VLLIGLTNFKMSYLKNIYGDYAQKNLMQYKYNDDNATYNDGSILINNQNIADSKVIKIKIIFTRFRFK
jgi:hypothetical protein